MAPSGRRLLLLLSIVAAIAGSAQSERRKRFASLNPPTARSFVDTIASMFSYAFGDSGIAQEEESDEHLEARGDDVRNSVVGARPLFGSGISNNTMEAQVHQQQVPVEGDQEYYQLPPKYFERPESAVRRGDNRCEKLQYREALQCPIAGRAGGSERFFEIGDSCYFVSG